MPGFDADHDGQMARQRGELPGEDAKISAVFVNDGDNLSEILAAHKTFAFANGDTLDVTYQREQRMLDGLALAMERQMMGPVTGHWEPIPPTPTVKARQWIGDKVRRLFDQAEHASDALAEWLYEGGISGRIDRAGRRIVDRILPSYRATHRWIPNPEAQPIDNPNCRCELVTEDTDADC